MWAMLDESQRRQLDSARQELLASTLLDDDAKDNLMSFMECSANAANGSVERLKDMASAQFQNAIYHVRTAVRTPKAMATMITDHAKSCKGPALQQAPPPPPPMGKVAIVLALAKCWPIWIFASVLSFSPNCPAIIEMINKLLK
jgi:hypothetical protein